MLSKKIFVDSINSLKNFEEGVHKIEEVLNCYIFDNNLTSPLIENFINILEEGMNDTPPYPLESWISDWCYNHNFGTEWSGEDWMIGDKYYNPKTPEELYEFLVKLYGEEDEDEK